MNSNNSQLSSPLAIHHSYWTQRAPLESRYPALKGKHQTEVLVLGGGITGMSVALELLERGKSVTVCEAQVIGSGTTGGSSAHLDAHPEGGPGELIRQLGEEQARAFTQMRLEAIQRIEQRAGDDCEFQRIPGYRYTESQEQRDKLREDWEAARKLGLTAEWCHPVPIPQAIGGYVIEGMARFDSLAYLRKLAELVQQQGGRIYEHTLVAGPSETNPTSLEAGEGSVEFEQVVCAAHSNCTSSQSLNVQTLPVQSYVIAARVGTPLADGLFWDNEDPYHYIRRATRDGHTILVGGEDHRTGADDEVGALQCLEDWMRARFDVQEIITRWSAELYEPTDGLPFIGKVSGQENVWIATGLSGIGLTLGTAAGILIADLITGRPVELAEALSPGRISLLSAPKLLLQQIPAAIDYSERVLPARSIDPEELRPGQGAVGSFNGNHVAMCRDCEGCVHVHSAICTHMGGVVRWNETEQTWDCPVHGGRFTAEGQRLYGPPQSDLGKPGE